jgi:Protein of unknown function (DUF4245)
MAVRRRGFETVADMFRSMGLVLVVVALVVLITIRTKGQEIRLVDVGQTYSAASVGGATPFPLVLPVGLSDRWRATSVYYDPPERTGVPGVTDWHVGYVTPANQYAGFEQTNGPAKVALAAELTAPAPAGSVTLGGQTWQRWAQADGQRRALLRTEGAVTVVVDGTAGWPELEQLAGSLQVRPAAS